MTSQKCWVLVNYMNGVNFSDKDCSSESEEENSDYETCTEYSLSFNDLDNDDGSESNENGIEDPNPIHDIVDEESEHTLNSSLEDGQHSWYPQGVQEKPHVASSVQIKTGGSIVNVTTGDEPTIHEALSVTLEEQSLWQSALDAEFASLDDKKSWVRDNSPDAQPLPIYPVLKVKRRADGTVERFKARMVAD